MRRSKATSSGNVSHGSTASMLAMRQFLALALMFGLMTAACLAFETAGSSTLRLWKRSQNANRGTLASRSAKKPTFISKTQKWERASDDDGKYPYDAVGSLLRHGPAPFLSRLTDPAGYEQTVLAYMASTGVSRAEATGNMDAKLNNPADWAYRKLEEKRGKPKVDFTRLDKKDAALVVLWAVFITPLTLSVIVQTISQYEGPHRPM